MTVIAKKIKNKFSSLSDSMQRIVAILTSLVVVCGMFTGALSYAVGQLDAHIADQTKELKKNIEDVQLSSTRNELLTMMQFDPDNVVGIERLAKHYFKELKGDLYMTGKYSSWAKKYGGDTSFVVYHD
jgi:predicted PurR-regulated permease PerM